MSPTPAETISQSESMPETAPAPVPIPVTSLATLSNDLMVVKTITISARGKVYEFRIRALNSSLMNDANRLLDFLPPLVEKVVDGEKKPEFDTLDENYRGRKDRARLDRRAMLIAESLVTEIPGDTRQERMEWVENNLPDWLLAQLLDEIEAISASDAKVVDLANFSSSADSPES